MTSNLGQVFYSRRIGRAPQRRLGGPTVQYVDAPETSTIAGAAKLSGRVGDRWSLGLLEAVTLREEAHYLDAQGAEGSAFVEPLSNYLVGRARRDSQDGYTSVGGIVTAVTRKVGDPALRDLLHSDAYVAGLDFSHTWGNREWFVNGSLVGSRVAGSSEAILRTQLSSVRYYQRPDAHHVVLDSTRTSLSGYRATFTAGRQAGQHWLGYALLTARSPGPDEPVVALERTTAADDRPDPCECSATGYPGPLQQPWKRRPRRNPCPTP